MHFYHWIIIGLLMGETLLGGVTTRIKDVTHVRGISDYGVSGIGLVVGLAGDGDRSQTYTLQAFSNLLKRNNILVPPDSIQSKNVAIVEVQALISSSEKVGSMVDVTISSMGDAKSLRGGTLLRTLLYGPDQITAYATVQGPISVGGFSAGSSGAGGASITKNHPLVGQIIKGARVVTEVPEQTVVKQSPEGAYFELELAQPDYANAFRIASAINAEYEENPASPENARYVRVSIPNKNMSNFVGYLAQIEPLTFTPDLRARVLISEKTGIILATSAVKISSCAIAVGEVTISIANQQNVAMPGALAPAAAEAVVTNATDATVDTKDTGLVPMDDMPTIQEVAQSLNSLGIDSPAIISIFQAMEKIGALQAEIVYQ
ncbi:MAG: flagellar basal body P-ring protein FlgI [Verrucomicrobiota bacterium]|jgi:flagellar P-ring protein FlgI|nr:flagellar basal body P-ring protein FlgI [Verrucomicrobiota bacterium]